MGLTSLFSAPSPIDLSTKQTASLRPPLIGSSTACFRSLQRKQPASRSHHLQTFILPSKYLSVMMYISAFPTAIAMRETNVYEERSLGVYEHDSDSEAESRNGKHIELAVNIQRQPGFDLWYVMLGLFLIALTEGGRLQKAADDPAFWLFSVLFEIVLYGSSGSVRDILRQKQACVPSLIGCQNWSLSQCSCVEDIVDSHTHWIMRFCCHVNRMKMTRRKDRAGWELGSRGVLRV